ncbi:hypothetical protein NDQ72_18995 [Halomonas sp. KG2]|uniref:hypothetical protein n=1 Tax=Halomonas sp. KG2 TaxID=2951138 RepID=UPI002649921E|nr:hypothetical protein [Halomonas sp. KG2]WKD28100.1 hypothetical protein NDQ72_18995 [Halomonas sp. KG2]
MVTRSSCALFRKKAGLDNAEVIGAALALLVDHGYLTELEPPTTGRPRTDYYWHPDYLPD